MSLTSHRLRWFVTLIRRFSCGARILHARDQNVPSVPHLTAGTGGLTLCSIQMMPSSSALILFSRVLL